MLSSTPDEGTSRPNVGNARESVAQPNVLTIDEATLKALRGLGSREDIVSTESLVEAHNKAELSSERELLLVWLSRYDAVLSRLSTERLQDDLATEYALLARLKMRTPSENGDRILKQLMSTLRDQLRRRGSIEKGIPEAMYHVLTCIDPRVFAEDTWQLLLLADELMSSLGPGPIISKTTFPIYKPVFQALHQTFVLLQTTNQNKLPARQKQRYQQTFAAKLEEMSDSAEYYPVYFNSMLIEQSIQRLTVKEEVSHFAQTVKCIAGISCGLLYIFHGLRALAVFDVDPASIEEGYARLKKMRASGLGEARQWYDMLQRLSSSGLASVHAPEKTSIFKQNYDAVMDFQRGVRSKEDSKALRYGLILELCRLAVLDSHTQISRDALDKLLGLGTQLASDEGWTNDAMIKEALLDSVYAVHTHRKKSIKTTDALKSMVSFDAACATSTVREWLGDRTVEEILTSRLESDTQTQPARLFNSVRIDLGIVSSEERQQNIACLKLRYKTPKFAHAVSMFDKKSYKHVNRLEFHVVFTEGQQTEELQDEEEDLPYVSLQDQPKHHAIPLEELFQPRRLGPNLPAIDVRRVLIFGNPGAGKTCIGKTIAHQWATGLKWLALEAVYVIHVRDLNIIRETSQGLRCNNDPTSSIASICFPEADERSYINIRAQIDNDLDKASTLFILDGLDEGDDAMKEMLCLAEHRLCKILLLSRPDNLEWVQEFVDIKMECSGFDDDQLTRFIGNELPKDEAYHLLEFMKAKPSLWRISHVPINAHILSFIWKEETTDAFVEFNVSLGALYFKMSLFVWSRYLKKYEPGLVDRQIVFEALESIAFEALEAEQVLIKQSLVEDRTGASPLKGILQDSGFLLLQMEGIKYQFPHLTFQEFFAGRHLSKSLLSESPYQREEALNFIERRKYRKKYNVTLSFATEEVYKLRGIEGFRLMLELVNKSPIEVVGVQNMFMKLSILETCLSTRVHSLTSTLVQDGEANRLVHSIFECIKLYKETSHLVELTTTNLECSPNTLRSYGRHLHNIINDAQLTKKKIRQIVRLIKHVPECVDRVREVLARDFHHGSTASRKTVMRNTAEVISQIPDSQEALLPIIVSGSGDADRDVRHAAVAQISSLLDSVPAKSEVFGRIIAKGVEDEAAVRATAMIQVAAFLKEVPQQTEALLDILLKGAKDPNELVRAAAVSQIAPALAANSTLSSKLLQTLNSACEDGDAIVRREAVRQFEGALESCPELLSVLLDLLTKRTRDKDDVVRRAAIAQVAKVIPMARQSHETLLGLLSKGMDDPDENVCAAAARRLASVLAATPGLSREILALFFKASSDRRPALRKAAILQVPGILQCAFPESEAVLNVLERGILDRNCFVRGTALWSIPDALLLVPWKAQMLKVALAKAIEDPDEWVRHDTGRSLQKLQLKILLELHSISQAPRLAHEIGRRLLHSAVTVESLPRSDHLRLVIHTHSNQIHWDDSASNVHALMDGIRATVQEEYPGLFKLISPDVCGNP